MEGIPEIWNERRTIESFDVDMQGRLRPQALLAYLLNSAWNHTRGTGYGYAELATRNLMWVLIKVQLIIKRLPAWGDRITIETWGKRLERLYAFRDFIVWSSSGEKLVSATSQWMVLDKTNGRPQRFDPEAHYFPWLPDREELPTDLKKVRESQAGKKIASFRVLFSDIDVNRHVNSGRYFQWMLDSHSQEWLEAKTINAADLSFLSEAMPDEQVEIHSELAENLELCSVRRTGDCKELCRARLEWSG
jgi:medium-chain acyl-[acyl-carrier-protein] hydrolase